MKCVGLVVGLLVVGSLFGKEASFGDFDARAKAGERLTVAFFGGSLTWSANATEPNVTGFRGLMAPFWVKRRVRKGYNYLLLKVATTGTRIGQFRREWGAKVEAFRVSETR